MVSKSLRDQYPQFSFLGEETYTPGTPLTSAPTFICDPIDGTTNFVHNYPNFCISLGLSINRKSVVGVIYHPSRHDLYTAIVGKGAFVTHLSTNQVSQLPLQPPLPLVNLQSCLLAVEWGAERSGPNWHTKVDTFNHLAASVEDGGKMVHSMRSIGSAALNFVSVARGDVDAYWEGGPWPWDVAAGWIIVEEAGGVVLEGNKQESLEKGRAQLDSRKFLVVRGAPSGQEEVAKEFWESIKGSFNYEF
jgi:myo-inositol-1(or 4)-monophosphatase